MTLRRRTPFVLVVLALAITACDSNGEPSWSLASSTSTAAFHGPQVEDLTGMVIDWEFAEDVDSWVEVPDDFEWGIRQRNPQIIEVGWWGLGCDDDLRLVVDTDVLELTLDGYFGDRPDPEVGCAMMGIWREFHLTFAQPIDVGSLRLEVIEPPG